MKLRDTDFLQLRSYYGNGKGTIPRICCYGDKETETKYDFEDGGSRQTALKQSTSPELVSAEVQCLFLGGDDVSGNRISKGPLDDLLKPGDVQVLQECFPGGLITTGHLG